MSLSLTQLFNVNLSWSIEDPDLQITLPTKNNSKMDTLYG